MEEPKQHPVKWEPSLGRWLMDGIFLLALGALGGFLATSPKFLHPIESATLMLFLGLAWLLAVRVSARYEGETSGAGLADAAQRLLEGDRAPLDLQGHFPRRDRLVAQALNLCLKEREEAHVRLRAFHEALGRDWLTLEETLRAMQHERKDALEAFATAASLLRELGEKLLPILEDPLLTDQLLFSQRLRTDQERMQGFEFLGSVEQLKSIMERIQEVLDVLLNLQPGIISDGDLLGESVGHGTRISARMGSTVSTIVNHAPRLLEASRERLEQVHLLRQSVDDLQYRASMAMNLFRKGQKHTQVQNQEFQQVWDALEEINQVAQQTGLLAVNAAILTSQESSTTGALQTIGNKIRLLSEQSAQSTAVVSRIMSEHQQRLDREFRDHEDGLESLEEMLASASEVHRVLDAMLQRNGEMERRLDEYRIHVDGLHQVSSQLLSNLQIVNFRVDVLLEKLGRQRSAITKLKPEMDNLGRSAERLQLAGDSLAHTNFQNLAELGELIGHFLEIRQSGVYRLIQSGELEQLEMRQRQRQREEVDRWRSLHWLRTRRRTETLKVAIRLQERVLEGDPLGEGEYLCRLLARDALGQPAPSAIYRIEPDGEARNWRMHLVPELNHQEGRMALLSVLQYGEKGQSLAEAWLPGLDVRLVEEGVQIVLPHSYPNFPLLIAGLGLSMKCQVENLTVEPPKNYPRPVQRFLWVGPQVETYRRTWIQDRIHGSLRNVPLHELLLEDLPHEGYQEYCPHCVSLPLEEEQAPSLTPLAPLPKVALLGIGQSSFDGGRWLRHLTPEALPPAEAEAVLGEVHLPYEHPEAFLLALFRPSYPMAAYDHPELRPLKARFWKEVLAMEGDETSHAVAWDLLMIMQKQGWLMSLPLEV